MKVAVYHPWIHMKGGGERILIELLRKSRHKITLFTSHYDRNSTFPDFEKFKVIEISRIPIKGELFRGLVFTAHLLLSKIDLQKFDVFAISTGGIGELISMRNRSKPILCICLTPLRIAHDMSIFQYKMKRKNLVSRQIYKISIFLYKLLEKMAWKKFDRVICISGNVRKRILDGKLIGRGKIRVSYPGVDFEKAETNGSFMHYFFYPSRFAYYKRHDLAIEAFKIFRKRNGGDFKLVLAGGLSKKNKEYFDSIKTLAGNGNDIEIRTNISDEEIRSLYKNCYCVLFCGMNEDWGMIPIEAGLYKKPVISVAEGGPLESVIDGKTGFLVPAQPWPLAMALENIVKDEKRVRRMGEENFRNVMRFEWKKFINDFDMEIENIAKNKKANQKE